MDIHRSGCVLETGDSFPPGEIISVLQENPEVDQQAQTLDPFKWIGAVINQRWETADTTQNMIQYYCDV